MKTNAFGKLQSAGPTLLWLAAGLYAVLLLSLRSPFLDDPDAANFALAVIDFDVTAGRPHPPGYPLYIAIAKVLRPLFSSETALLTAISSVSTALLIPVLFQFLRAGFGALPALLSVLVFCALPVTVLEGTKAMTDMPGLLAGFSVLLLTRWAVARGGAFALVLSGVALGLVGGIRPHAWLFAVPIALALVPRRSWAKYGLAFLLGLAMWLVPTCLAVGTGAYFDIVWKMFMGRFCRTDITLLGSSAKLLDWGRRFFEFPYIAFYSGLGVEMVAMRALDVLALVALGGILFLAASASTAFGRSGVRAVRVGMGLYFLYLLLFLPTTNVRYFVPLMLWVSAEVFALLAWPSLSVFRRAVFGVVVGVFCAVLGTKSYHLVLERNAVPPPPLAAVRAIQKQALGVPSAVFGFRHSFYKYYWPDAPFVSSEAGRCQGMEQALQEGKRVFTMDFKPCQGLVFTRFGSFERNRQVHWKAHRALSFEVSREPVRSE